MIDEKLQFAISQYADGALPPAEAAAMEARLAGDPELRRLLEEYRRLDGMIRNVAPPPEMDWDRFAAEISEAVDEDAREVVPAQHHWGWRPTALAAGVLLCLSAAILLWSVNSSETLDRAGVVAIETRSVGDVAVVSVFGTEQPVSRQEVLVQIGQARPRGAQINWMMDDVYPELTASVPSRVLISSVHAAPADEDLMLLH